MLQSQPVSLRAPPNGSISYAANIQNTFLYKIVNCERLAQYLLSSICIMQQFFFCLSGPCIPNPCHNGGTCEISEAYRGDTFIGYVCKCPRGFNGIHCQHSKSSIVVVLLLVLIAKYTSHYHSCWS